MPNFENIHKNKKLAFLDGLLCGLVIVWIASLFKKAVNDTPQKRMEPESPENTYYLSDYAEQR